MDRALMVPKYEWSAMSVCVSVCVYKTGPEDDHWSTRQRHKGNLHAVFTQCIVNISITARLEYSDRSGHKLPLIRRLDQLRHPS